MDHADTKALPTHHESMPLRAAILFALVEELDSYIASRPDYVVDEEKEVPEELRESLKALGYVE